MLPCLLLSGASEALQFNALLEFMKAHLLFQIIRDPTRKNNIIDLILCNKGNEVNKYEQLINKELSDHNAIMVQMEMYPDMKKGKNVNKDFYDTDLYKYDLSRTPENDSCWYVFEELVNNCDWNSPVASGLNNKPPDLNVNSTDDDDHNRCMFEFSLG